MVDKFFKLISKYALLLSFFYAIEFIFNRYIEEIIPNVDLRRTETLITMAPHILGIILNLTTALIIVQDRRKLGIETKYVVLATILYRLIGVCAFFIFVLHDKDKLKEE